MEEREEIPLLKPSWCTAAEGCACALSDERAVRLSTPRLELFCQLGTQTRAGQPDPKALVTFGVDVLSADGQAEGRGHIKLNFTRAPSGWPYTVLLTGTFDCQQLAPIPHPSVRVSWTAAPGFAGALWFGGTGPGKRFTVMGRFPYEGDCVAPLAVRSLEDETDYGQFLLIRYDDGVYGLIAGVPSEAGRGWVSIDTGAVSTGLSTLGPETRLTGEIPLAVMGLGRNPVDLFQAVVARTVDPGCRRLHRPWSGNPRNLPDALRHLGYMTDGAHLAGLSADEIRRTMELLERQRAPLRTFIVGPGWENVSGERLVTVEPRPSLFPHGLAGVKRTAARHRFRWAGVSHALALAAHGIDPANEIYRTEHRAGVKNETGCILPEPRRAAVFALYGALYEYLADEGIDLALVRDVLATRPYAGVAGQPEVLRGLLVAQSAAAAKCMGVLYEGAQSTAALKWLSRRACARVDGLLDGGDADRLVQTFTNLLWMGTLCHTMVGPFQSAGPRALTDALVRVLAGSPVLINDYPDAVESQVLLRLCDDTGHVLYPDRPALPTPRSLDALIEGRCRVLEVETTVGEAPARALFNLTDAAAETDLELDSPEGERLAVWPVTGRAEPVTLPAKVHVRLEPGACELAILVPRRGPLTVAGLDGKLLGYGSLSMGYFTDGVILTTPSGGYMLVHSETGRMAVRLTRESAFLKPESLGGGLYRIGPVNPREFVSIRW